MSGAGSGDAPVEGHADPRCNECNRLSAGGRWPCDTAALFLEKLLRGPVATGSPALSGDRWMHLTDDLYRRYLDLLGLDAVPVSVAGLSQVVARHLVTVPFENLSKRLYQLRGADDIPDPATWLDDVGRHHLGGTCFANNYHLWLLLRRLGFEARLCGASMGQRPDVHLALVVVCEGREYLVDAGFGAPFRAPIARDEPQPQVFPLGNQRWVVLPPDAAGRTRVEYQVDGTKIYAYVLDPRPRAWQEFRGQIAATYHPEALFMKILRIVRFLPDGAIILADRHLTRYAGGSDSTVPVTSEALPGTIEAEFGISASLVREAIGAGGPGEPIW